MLSIKVIIRTFSSQTLKQTIYRCRAPVCRNHFEETLHTIHIRNFASIPGTPDKRDLPLITSRKLEFLPRYQKPKQAWLETLETVEDVKLGIVDLHPDIFSTHPRLDVLWQNVQWQQRYRNVDYRSVKNRAELKGGGRKVYKQKGTGRARHGSINSPLYTKGGAVRGPRGPTSDFYMLSTSARVLGLANALTIKFAQDNLHIVNSLKLPTDDPQFLEDLIELRGWGLSVLFVDDTDIIPANVAVALDEIKQYNVMPTYGLNVYSMLKHETLVLTLPALQKIEQKLLEKMHAGVQIDFKHSKIST